MISIRKNLALATCSLLSQQASAQAFENDWEVDSSYLSYQESADRISVSKFIGNVQGKVSDQDTVNFKLVHDTISGASPTGAVKSKNESVTFTSASGGSGFNAGSDGSSKVYIEDTRLSFNADWQHDWNQRTRTSYGANLSSENDYESLGGSLNIERDNRSRQTTYSAGLGLSSDTIFRNGTSDTPAPMTSTDSTEQLSKGERNTWDTMAGISHIINKRTVGQINLTYTLSQGYHTDPYKVISAIDAEGNIVDTFYENRPGERNRTSLYSKLAHQLADSENTVHASYRLYQDDWNIRSHTFDLKYRNGLPNQQFIEPHIRLYRQTAADFYKHHLAIDQDVNVRFPEKNYVSADYRLDRFWSYSAGLKYGRHIGQAGKLRVRLEYMKQTFAHSEYKTNSAVILQLSYKHAF